MEATGRGTPYALAEGLYQYDKGNAGEGASPYWTRTRDNAVSGGVCCVKLDGHMGSLRCGAVNEGVRPAVRILFHEGRFACVSGDVGALPQTPPGLSPWTHYLTVLRTAKK